MLQYDVADCASLIHLIAVAVQLSRDPFPMVRGGARTQYR